MTSQTQDARHVPLSKVDKLRQDASNAASVRAFQTHPDVVALRVESVRTQVDALMWVGIVLGLAFTMVNVQTFAAGTARPFTLAWCAAWLLDPMVSLVLIAVLRAEQVTARYQVPTGAWVRRTKVFAFAATYVMNTWASWSVLDAAGIVLHSVPPILVYCAAEAGPTVRDRLTEAVLCAARMATTATPPGEQGTVQQPATPATAAPFTEPFTEPLGEPFTNTPRTSFVNTPAATSGGVHEHPTDPTSQRSAPARRAARKPARQAPARRMLRADYVAQAQAAWTPGTHVTPAWVRQVTDCSRGMSSQVAADLKAALDTTTPPASPVYAVTATPATPPAREPTESEAA
jgi:hypothetical protein